ncbi:MAG: hypothetical protein ABI638_12995 [Ignavibacteriota bacterium]
MKKQLVVIFTLVAIGLITFSCEPFIENKITAKNLAAAGVVLNLRGQDYNIPSGETLVLNDFKKGSFAYSTVYQIPLGVTNSSTSGDVVGQMNLLAGTEVLLVYTSVVDSAQYTLYGSLTTSDDINRVDPFETGGTP